jgi:hypothetical protein
VLREKTPPVAQTLITWAPLRRISRTLSRSACGPSATPGRGPVELGRQEGLVAMAAGGAERIGGRDDARPDQAVLVDRLHQGDVGIMIGADVADGGEARLEHVAGMARGHHRLEQVGELKRIVGAVIGARIEMDVHVDQAGQQRVAGQIDPARVRRNQWPGAAAADDRDDAAVGDDDYWLVDRAAGKDVDHAVGR